MSNHWQTKGTTRSKIYWVNYCQNKTIIQILFLPFKKILKRIGKFTDAIKTLKIDSPNVNVETNQDKVIGCIGDMKDALLGGLSALIPKEQVKEEPKEANFEHKIVRDRNGFIDKIISNKK